MLTANGCANQTACRPSHHFRHRPPHREKPIAPDAIAAPACHIAPGSWRQVRDRLPDQIGNLPTHPRDTGGKKHSSTHNRMTRKRLSNKSNFNDFTPVRTSSDRGDFQFQGYASGPKTYTDYNSFISVAHAGRTHTIILFTLYKRTL